MNFTSRNLDAARVTPATLALIAVSCPACGENVKSLVARGRDFEYETSSHEFTLMACLECGTLYLDPRPAIEELERLYPKHYGPYHFNHEERSVMRFARNAVERRRAERLFELAGNDGRVLDVGCGDGRWLRLLREVADRRGARVQLEGVEFSADAADRAERRAGATVHRGIFEQLDLPESSYDLVVLKDVVEHVADPRAVMGSVARLLRRGGRVFVETPNFRSLDRRLFAAREWGGYHFPRHFQLFDRATISRICADAGLRVESVNFVPSPVFWTFSLRHWLLERGRHRLANFFTAGNPLPIGLFYAFDALRIAAGRPTSKLELVAKR